jgi:hypothetical protein
VSGHTFDTIYDLYLTNERFVTVLIRDPGDVMPAISWFTIFVPNYSARKKENREREEIAAERRRKARTLNLDELIARNPNTNFQISNDDVINVMIKKDIFRQSHLKINFNVSGRILSKDFTIDKNHVLEAKQILSKALPTKFTM